MGIHKNMNYETSAYIKLQKKFLKKYERLKGTSAVKDKKTPHFFCHLEFVANADEAEFPRLLFGILDAAGVLKQLSNKFVFGFTY